jgi:SAM-dependent methyltransferase
MAVQRIVRHTPAANLFYAADLAYIHHTGFSGYARHAAPEFVRLLHRYDRQRQSAERVRAIGQPRRVVEIGCGGGIVARALSDAGYRVVGVDISPAMLRLARSHAPKARFSRGSWATTRIPPCDAIFAIGEILNYDNGFAGAPGARRRTHERDLSRFFARAFHSLSPGGLLVFDFMASTRRRTYRQFRLEGRDWTLVMRATARHGGKLLTRDLVLTRAQGPRRRRSEETHFVQIYSKRQMRRLLESAGFGVRMTDYIGRMRVFRSNVAAICVKPA